MHRPYVALTGQPISWKSTPMEDCVQHQALIHGAILMPDEYLKSVDYMGLGTKMHGKPYDVTREAGGRRDSTLITWKTKKVVTIG